MVHSRTTFPRTLRMTAADEFKSALHTRPIAHGKIFSLHWCNGQGSSGRNSYPKLGFVVPKRVLRLATDRNRIKRVLRESFRASQANLPVGLYLFRMKTRPTADSKLSLKQIARDEADFLLKKAASRP